MATPTPLRGPQPATPDMKRGLIVKLCEVMMAVDRIAKAGTNEHFKYKFATEADVSAALRGELAERHIMYITSITDIRADGNLTTVFTEHRFIDGEDGETLTFTWASQGQDTQDKGVSKGATSAVKYSLLKQFLIPTGDDPDQDGPSPRAKASVKQQSAAAQEPDAQQEHAEAPYASQKNKDASLKAKAWFHSILRDRFGLEHEAALKLLGKHSFSRDLAEWTMGQTIDAIAARVGKV